MRLFAEVKRRKPSIIFIPDVDVWYASLSQGPALPTFRIMLRSLAPTDPILLLGTCETELSELNRDLRKDLFGYSKGNRVEIAYPTTVSNVFAAVGCRVT